MLNQVVLVGRIFAIEDNEVTIAVPRSLKNSEGEYDTDYISILITGDMNNSVHEYCEKGDIIGIKGRIEALDAKISIRAEKISFLSTKRS